MTGQVLNYSIQTSEGIISGNDSQRYTFAGSDWPGASVPARGALVDFDVQDGSHAVSIYLIESAPPAAVATPTATRQSISPATAPKSRQTAALLALLIGGLGVHKFYLGEKGGVLRIVLSCTFIGALISVLLALLDAIKLFTMTDTDFDQQYN